MSRKLLKLKKLKSQIKEEPDQNQPSSRPSNTMSQIRPTEEEDSDLGLDWDKNHQSRFVKWVFQQKKDQQYERGRLDIYWRRIKEERSRLEKEKRDLELASADLAQRINQVKDVLPLVMELKSMGVGFSHINSWINVIREYASKKMVDERTATWRLAEDLKNWQELGGFENAIQNAKNQLALLNMTLEDQKAAIATLVHLQKAGMSEEEISKLCVLVGRWNSNGAGLGKGVGQANGSKTNSINLELDTHLNLPTKH